MSVKDVFIADIKHESAQTKRMLEKVPMDKSDWKPHDKSMSLIRLAVHTAVNLGWASRIIHMDDFDFKTYSFPVNNITTSEELVALLQKRTDEAVADLEKMSDDDLSKIWTVRNGDQVYYQLPKKVAIRNWALNHMIHHRGQLSVYLRLLDVAVPGMYGPSADETM